MPAGALWRLQYEDDLDHRIQARSDRQRFAQDRNVLTATIHRNASRILLDVQLIDDANSTFDESLRITYDDNAYEERVLSEERSFNTRYMGQFPPDIEPRLQVPPEVRENIISEYIRTSEGRRTLAASMVAPLRIQRDYASIARRAFIVEPLPEGALPIYDQDPEAKKASDFKTPEWVEAGTCVKNSHGDYATIVMVTPIFVGHLLADSRVDYSIWRDPGPNQSMLAERFCDQWLPSEPPQEPRTRFERILMDDD